MCVSGIGDSDVLELKPEQIESTPLQSIPFMLVLLYITVPGISAPSQGKGKKLQDILPTKPNNILPQTPFHKARNKLLLLPGDDTCSPMPERDRMP